MPNIFIGTQTEMRASCAKVAVHEEEHVNNQLRECFGSNSMLQARGHLNIFLHLAKKRDPLLKTLGGMNQLLVKNAGSSFDLALLLESGNMWIDSGAANMDVCKLGADLRNKVYIIGSTNSSDKRDLLRGGTFVPSDDMTDIKEQCSALITFAFNNKWPSMRDHQRQVQEIYDSVLMSMEGTGEDDIRPEIHERVVDTNIIPGLLVSLLLEPASWTTLLFKQ